jgi:hypothetical protein
MIADQVCESLMGEFSFYGIFKLINSLVLNFVN